MKKIKILFVISLILSESKLCFFLDKVPSNPGKDSQRKPEPI